MNSTCATLTKGDILAACDSLRTIKDPFKLSRHDYAGVGSYLDDLAGVEEEAVTVTDFLDWAASWEQTALCDASRIVLELSRKASDVSEMHIEDSLTIEEGEVRVVAGDLEIRGNLYNAGTLLVGGSLVVGGVIRSEGEEWISGTLYVSGNVRVRGCYLMGPTMIIGDLIAEKAVCGCFFDDGGALWVGGRLEAALYIGLADRRDIIVGKSAQRRLQGKALIRTYPEHFDDDDELKDIEPFLATIGIV